MVNPLLPNLAFAEAHCNAISQLIARAVHEQQTAGVWAMTVSPSRIQNLRTSIQSYEAAYANTTNLADQAALNANISALNALISAGFAVAGIFATASAAPIFLASVGVAGVFLVADALTAPEAPHGLTIAADVGVNRLGNILSVAGDDAYAVSTRSAVYSAAAGKLVGVVGFAMAALDARKKLGISAKLTTEEKRLKKELEAYKSELKSLEKIAYAEEVRRACMKAAQEDLRSAYNSQTPQCLL